MISKTHATVTSAISPANSRLPILALFFGVCGILAIHFDTSMIAYADATHLRGDVGRMVDLAETFAFGPAALVIAFGVVLADQRSKWFTARLFAYPILAGTVANVAKLAIPRLRPRGLADLTNLQDGIATGWDTFAIASSDASFRNLGDGSSAIVSVGTLGDSDRFGDWIESTLSASPLVFLFFGLVCGFTANLLECPLSQ
jgi:hypothetical protein